MLEFKHPNVANFLAHIVIYPYLKACISSFLTEENILSYVAALVMPPRSL